MMIGAGAGTDICTGGGAGTGAATGGGVGGGETVLSERTVDKTE
jgi:hypothetical protein